MELDIGKLAMWRLQTHEQFGGTWLSDYVPNRLGGFIEEHPEQEQKKPDCPLIGEDSNIFHLMGIASKTLKRNGMAEQAKEMCDRITSSGDYNKSHHRATITRLSVLSENMSILRQLTMTNRKKVRMKKWR